MKAGGSKEKREEHLWGGAPLQCPGPGRNVAKEARIGCCSFRQAYKELLPTVSKTIVGPREAKMHNSWSPS